MKYKNRVRSRISNLKDAKNPGLRRKVLCGSITPQQIAVMTSEVSPAGAVAPRPAPARPGLRTEHASLQEMASDELKEIRKAMTKEAIREHQMARTGGTQTDLFTCGKCRKKNCTYTQVRPPDARAACRHWSPVSSISGVGPACLGTPKLGELAGPAWRGPRSCPWQVGGCGVPPGCGGGCGCGTTLRPMRRGAW